MNVNFEIVNWVVWIKIDRKYIVIIVVTGKSSLSTFWILRLNSSDVLKLKNARRIFIQQTLIAIYGVMILRSYHPSPVIAIYAPLISRK